MALFRIEGLFPAEDIDDALSYLGRHFTAVATGEVDDERTCNFHVGRNADVEMWEQNRLLPPGEQ